MTATLLAGLLGGVIAAGITLAGVLITNRWRLAEENVIKQRAEWRGAVRLLISEAVNIENEKDARRIWAEIALRMNPDEDPKKDDAELVALVRDLSREENRTDDRRERIVNLAAHILKHDWTRAKWEAQGWFWEEEPEQTRCPGERRI
ncbi:hypothetical protein [Sphingomonas sp. CROZ-RG-20F-R02-07]|uniref:hypothetical protein n=1 Tax=Sphingomonas sp. CROZ-RG-20F-R02-07 TaxID=2914832 RepID=UPI001F5A91E8|nr:hypothetical protein [Sphingomonas sp. CROZ-RG-20F-R02-07]